MTCFVLRWHLLLVVQPVDNYYRSLYKSCCVLTEQASLVAVPVAAYKYASMDHLNMHYRASGSSMEAVRRCYVRITADYDQALPSKWVFRLFSTV